MRLCIRGRNSGVGDLSGAAAAAVWDGVQGVCVPWLCGCELHWRCGASCVPDRGRCVAGLAFVFAECVFCCRLLDMQDGKQRGRWQQRRRQEQQQWQCAGEATTNPAENQG